MDAAWNRGQFHAQLRKRWSAGSTVPGEPL
jgi:hypothetical protein